MCRRRLARHHLLERTDDIVQAVRDIGGVQAQLSSAAEWSIGARVDGITAEDVRAELWERKRLLKMYTLRGTLHLVPSDEAALWAAATQPLDDSDELVDAIDRALRGRCLTRAELADAVGDERLLSQWGDFVSPAATRGVLCFGKPQGSKVTFVHRKDWGVPWKRHARATAQREAARRYLDAYGPAAPKDFARWMHIDPAEAKAAFDGLDGDGDAPPPKGPTAVRLLPQYDAYILGAFPRDKVVPPEAKPRISTYGKGKWEGPAALPLVLVDGVVAGMWARKGLKVTVEPFVDIDEPLLEAEVERLGSFLGGQASLTVARLP
ncbi:MAG TPA: winged helix DNA-binding domain-containing protein [Acidimicrobiales bacterium]|nr:winged helix DNA-binding domain-containing protein [Acidimicrobiales bacterium]